MYNKSAHHDVLEVPVTKNRKGRRSVITTRIDITKWSPASLVYKAFQAQAAIWRLEPPGSQIVSALRSASGFLSEITVTLLNSRPDELTREHVYILLLNLENDLRKVPNKASKTTEKYYFSFRCLLKSLEEKLADGFTFSEAASNFASHSSTSHRPKLATNPLPASLAQLKHVDIRDLHRQAEEQLKNRKRIIEQAACREIALYEDAFSFSRALILEEVEESTALLITNWVSGKRGDGTAAPHCSARQFAAVVLRLIRDDPPNFDENGTPDKYRLSRRKIDWSQLPQAKVYMYKSEVWPWFYIDERLPNAVLTAIFVLLLTHTGWNPSSVGDLTIDRIKPLPQGGYELQSYKSKTDDDTPACEVPRYLKDHCKAIELLIWNYNQLAKKKFIDNSNEKRLWFGWQDDGFKNIIELTHEKRITNFCQRHNIPRFVSSELRPLNAALTYLPQRDLEAVRVLLGHADLSTSNSYLENSLFFRLNEAKMLEFQRRIEATITYEIGGEELLKQRALPRNNVDQALRLVATGDGGACANPMDGPKFGRSENEEPCAALACTSGSGCPNYRLNVTKKTLEMAMRMRIYYKERWQRIRETNPTAFSELHLPKMLYMYVLLNIVKDQRPDLYLEAEKLLK